MSKIVPAEHIDPWYWEAVFTDGSRLEELEDDGTLHGFAEIDQSRLSAFILRPLDGKLPQHAVQLRADERLIFFRRRSLIAQMGADGEMTQQRGPTYHAVGVRRGETEAVTFIDQDGNTALSTDYNAV